MRRVSRDCLTAIAWLGFEIAKSPESIKFSACEILLSGVEQFLHPGMELEERVLACLCTYNYASGKGSSLVSKNCKNKINFEYQLAFRISTLA